MNKIMQMERIMNSTSYNNLAGVIVQKDGNCVYEQYFHGCDKKSTIHIASATKSIVSMLFGIALDRGELKSLEQKVLDFFPDYKVKRGETAIQNITLRNMLSMTATYKCKTEPYKKVFTSDDWITPALDLLGGRDPVRFRYSPIIGTHILSGIFMNATGRSLCQYANQNLFQPLGIKEKNNLVLPSREDNEAFLEAIDMNGWAIDPQGLSTAGWGLTLTTREMIRLGQLYLNQGKWEGQQIISEDWVTQSTEIQSISDVEDLDYGYLWWIVDEGAGCYAALGQYGNVIYVNKEKNLVIAITSLCAQNAADRLKLIRDYIEPAFS